ncbi:phage tail protein [Bradyrhizobium canariense]|uniref:Phage tail protein n=2 Tax=Bradyrhizobium canariense TaxID=255045 RepID=A0A1X3FIC5_9BRAD|nr:phage tail protein [Bradyrhizobium canariense]OSI77873.1 phage tail protein [Bradyrhizobium canariense]OSI86844.1 phage tail protein [Bradyrhizobium canariense]OSI89030.1 phage tail protein [Bradyrhizobium canariense]OSJ01487.1 phage tail protein [Bradyrhizobium canariense]
MAVWSKIANNNSDADSTVGFQEGQAPSSLNDGCRALMASAARWRDDVSGALVTTGSSAAYQVASNQNFVNLTDLASKVVAFTPHVTNAAGPVTMTVDGFANLPLRSAPNVELPAGVLIQGTPYVAFYNNTDHALYLQGLFGNPYNVPIGGMIDFIGPTAPNSTFVLPFGQAISRTTYATLYSMVGTTYGGGDGTTTFNVPDLRGRVVAGADGMGGSLAGRLNAAGISGAMNGAGIGAVGGEQAHALSTPELAPHSHANTLSDPGHSHTDHMNVSFGASGSTFGIAGQVSSSATSTNTTGISINNASAGSGNAHNNVQPTIVLSKILRII